MVLLSLDQSSRCSGYAVFVDDKLETFGKFSFDCPNVDSRLMLIKLKAEKLISEYRPDFVIFEDIQLQNNVANNVQTFKVLAEVYGVIAELLEEKKIPHSTVLAASWKSTLGIKGRTRAEQKKNAQQYVVNKYGLKVVQDVADAICIGEHYILTEKGAW